MKKILLKNANLVLENKIEKATVLVCEDKIEKIFSKDSDLSQITYDELIDLEGKYLGPAFVDVHVHGADGADAMDIDEEALRRISKYLAKEGTANFLVTTLTSTKDELKNVLEIAGKLQNKEIDGANIFGVHMEGPYFAVEYKGAQN